MTQTAAPDGSGVDVTEVVDLLDRYVTARRELTNELERIRTDTATESRISEATVHRLARLLDDSLVPGVRAKMRLDKLPPSAWQAGIAAWARRQLRRRVEQS